MFSVDYFQEINILRFLHLYQFLVLDPPTLNPRLKEIEVLGLSTALFAVYFPREFIKRKKRTKNELLNSSWYIINGSFESNLIIFTFFGYASMRTKYMTVNNCSEGHCIKYIIDFIPNTVSFLLSKTTFYCSKSYSVLNIDYTMSYSPRLIKCLALNLEKVHGRKKLIFSNNFLIHSLRKVKCS